MQKTADRKFCEAVIFVWQKGSKGKKARHRVCQGGENETFTGGISGFVGETEL